MSSPAQVSLDEAPLTWPDTDRASAIDDRSPDEMVQFLLPRRALAAIDPIAIIAEARRDGVSRRRIWVSDRGAGATEVHLACGFTMAVRVVRAIERADAVAASRCDATLLKDLAAANHAAMAALGSRVGASTPTLRHG